MEQHFYYFRQHPAQGRTTLVAPLSLQGRSAICTAAQFSLQLHRLQDNALLLAHTHSFLCSIAALKVVPDKHRLTDFLFLLDPRGRYAFWHPLAGFALLSNAPSAVWEQNEIFGASGQLPIFCDHIHHFDVLDTRGSILFSQRHQLHLIDYAVKAGGLRVEATRILDLSFVKYRQVGWVLGPKDPSLGVIEEKEEKTFFKVYRPSKGTTALRPEQACYRLELANLQEFRQISSSEVLLLSGNELLLVGKSWEVVARHPVRYSSGRLLALTAGIYGYLGEELVLVRGDSIKNYGGLQLEG
jgi:hypothetical protein